MTHRPRIALGLACAVLLAAALAAPASAAVRFSASLSGPRVVPGTGDPDGTASVSFTISAASRLCYVIRPRKLGSLRSAHIHNGSAGVRGSTFITLFSKPKATKNGRVTGCASITARKLELLAARSDAFYVDVHTTSFKAGAARGQLRTTRS